MSLAKEFKDDKMQHMYDYIKEDLYEFDISKFKTPYYLDIITRNAFYELKLK